MDVADEQDVAADATEQQIRSHAEGAGPNPQPAPTRKIVITALAALAVLSALVVFALRDQDSSDDRTAPDTKSTDGGVTWRAKSLSGAADFHGLQAARGSVYGYNSADGAFMVSVDQRTWDQRSRVAMGEFAVSPTDAQTILAVGRGGLQRSTDGGRSWQTVAGAPAVGLLAWDRTGVWGVTRDGAIWSSTDSGQQWRRRGAVPGQPHSIATHEGTLFAALAGDRIVATADAGATWTDRYAPE